jgi:hypothetical protein
MQQDAKTAVKPFPCWTSWYTQELLGAIPGAAFAS